MPPNNNQYGQPATPSAQPPVAPESQSAPAQYPQQAQQPQQFAQAPQPQMPQLPTVGQPGLQEQSLTQNHGVRPPADVQGGAANQPSKPAPVNPNSTQNSLQLSEVRESMVIMNDGSFRAVVACKSINFDLMSAREREGIEYSYQNFINSLNFPIQILIRSQRVDIGPYIEKLVNTRRSQDNMLLGVLMDDYINFIDVLAEEANIMEKSFYITIPFFPEGDMQNLINQGKGFFGKLFPKSQNSITRIDSVAYQKAKDEIANRVSLVQSGLFQIGVQSAQLDTQALGELYYSYYNPDTALRQPLGDFDTMATTFVKKAEPAQQGAQSPQQTPQGGM